VIELEMITLVRKLGCTYSRKDGRNYN